MKSYIVLIVVVQFILACTPLNSQAYALDRDQDPEQPKKIGLGAASGLPQSSRSVTSEGQTECSITGAGSHSDHDSSERCASGVTPPENIRHESSQMAGEKKTLQRISNTSKEQEHRILEELLVETVVP
jgi:hypothetical protein